MRHLVWEASFRRAFKRVTRRSPLLQDKVFQVLLRLVENPSDPVLKKSRGRFQQLTMAARFDCP